MKSPWKLNNLIFAGLQPKNEMYRFIPSMDITIIPLRYHLPGALPSKIYEAMACQVPIVLAAEGDPQILIERSNAGIVVDYYDTAAVLAAVNKLIEHPEERLRLGKNGRNYVLKHHTRPQIVQQLAEVIETTVTSQRSRLRNQSVAIDSN